MLNINLIINFIITLVNFLLVLVPVLLGVAILTLLERKVIGYMQFRKGPNLVGPLGVLQPLADGLKLFIKETFGPASSLSMMFIISPAVFFLLAILLWGLAPISFSGLNLELSFLLILGISSLSAYPVLVAGWASNSKYALLGALRGGAQIVSYEVSFSLIIFPLIFFLGSWNLGMFPDLSLYCFLFFPFFPLFLMWFISCLAETNRAPFDLTEGESELVSGYNVEFSGGPFALFFIGEYANIIFINVLSAILFFNLNVLSFTSVSPLFFSFFGSSLVFSFLWVRSSFPRIRYDQLMMLMWKVFLPLCLSFLFFYLVLVFIFFGSIL
uniref:NADH-ubiquinone oxidoreductase chain 1 n=1 Tax=Ophiothrix sp. TaxID=2909811 RepID=A0AAU6QCK1_9ECHI